MTRLHKTDQFGTGQGTELLFFCPGCKCAHGVCVTTNGWGWNGSMESPTFTPSVLVQTTKFTEKGEADYEEWAKAGYPKKPDEKLQFESKPVVCHSFVTDGMIKFLGDCTHELVNQTVPLEEF